MTYSALGVEVPAGAKIIRTSGQVGPSADADMLDGVTEQAAICFANTRDILAEGGIGVGDICHISV